MTAPAMETDERTRALGEHLLLQTYLFEVLVPIFYEKPDGKFDAIGTGTLLEIGDRLFIVTAAHVLDGCEGERLWSPWDRKDGTLGQWGTHSYLTPENSNRLDVAMVEIEFPETIAAFRNNYRLLNLAQIAAPTSGETHSRHGGAWFMIAACWYGAPALAERQCKVSVTSGSNLPHGLPYEPIMLTAEEWARGGSGGTMSLATMRIDPL